MALPHELVRGFYAGGDAVLAVTPDLEPGGRLIDETIPIDME